MRSTMALPEPASSDPRGEKRKHIDEPVQEDEHLDDIIFVAYGSIFL